MSWILITIIAYFLLAVVNLGDKFLINQVLPSTKVYVFLISALSGIVLLASPWFLLWPGYFWLAINLVVGIMFPIATYFMFEALRRGDASKITVLIGGLIPIFTILAAYFFLGDKFTSHQSWGLALLLIGTFLIAAVNDKKTQQKIKINHQIFYLSLLAAIFYALFFIGTKYAYNNQDFASSFIWIRVGSLAAVLLLLIRKSDRQEIFRSFRSQSTDSQAISRGNRVFILGNQAIGAAGFILQNYAISFGSIAIINALQGVQYAFLLILGWFLTIFKPKMIKENITFKVMSKKIIAILLIALGLYLITI